MNLSILHLSDMHIKDETDPVISRVDRIVAAVANRVIGSNFVLVAVTGDLSMTGTEDQIIEALALLDKVCNGLRETVQTAVTVELVYVPGNHDCDLSEDSLVRDRLLEVPGPFDEEVAQFLVRPQNAFFDLRDAFCPPTSGDRFFWQYEFMCSDKRIVVNCFNTSWCSRRNEEQGTLTFPVERLSGANATDASLVVALLHHPYNWLQAENAKALRRSIENSADLILTGHEHAPDHRRVSRVTGEKNEYIEGAALQWSSPHDEGGFHLINLDLDESTQRIWTFEWSDSRFEPTVTDPPQTDFQVNRARKEREFQATTQFQEFIDDLGIEVAHPESGRVNRDQVFVYPHVRKVTLRDREPGPLEGAEDLLRLTEGDAVVLITGPEESGKTTLAKQFFLDLQELGAVPVFLHGKKISKNMLRPERVLETVRTAFSEQYETEKYESYLQLDTDQRAIVFDDYHSAPITAESIDSVLRQLTAFFGKVYLFSDSMVQDVRNVQDLRRILDGRPGFVHYRIQSFGVQRREQLIERWVILDGYLAEDGAALARRIQQFGRTLDTVTGKSFVPSYPVYILAVLQAYESIKAVDLRASANAYFYELFIKNALALTSDKLDYHLKTSFLSFLAYRMLIDDSSRIDEDRLREFHSEFCTTYGLVVEFSQLQSLLNKSRLLVSVNGESEFKYEYCFYYFTALYLSEHLEETKIQEVIQDIADRIDEEESANILLFLTHLSKNPFILDQMVRRANEIFAGVSHAKLTLEDDLGFLRPKAE